SGKTKEMAKLMYQVSSIKYQGKDKQNKKIMSTLIITGQKMDNVIRGVRNIRGVDVMPADQLNAYEVLRHKMLVVTKESLEELKSQRRVRKNYQTGGFKKAIVTVKKGQVIPIFETPKEEVTVTTGESEPQIMKEKRNLLSRTKVKVEKSAVGASPTTQRKVIT